MRTDLVEKASKIITDPQILVNVVSQSVEQINAGRSPLVPTTPHMGIANIALMEIIEGKITYDNAPS